MSGDPLSVSESVADSSVMAAVDDADGVKRFVIADLDAEDSWLSVPLEAAPDLAARR